ncbi:hypothetical protein Dimus_038324 [Dionaea muscipula]
MIVAKIAGQSKLEFTNPRLEEQISIDMLGKRSSYLKGYGICKTNYSTKSQVFPNSEVLALKKVVEDQAMIEQSKVIVDQADDSRKIMNMMFFMTTMCGVDSTTIIGLIPYIVNEENTLDCKIRHFILNCKIRHFTLKVVVSIL